MEIPGSTHHYISADKLSVLRASWHKSKNLSTVLCIALGSSTLITWRTLCVVRMITVPIYLYLGGSWLSVNTPSFGSSMSFVRMKVLGLLSTQILLPCQKKFQFLSPCSACTSATSPKGLANQFNQLLNKWPFEDSRHFLIRTGGDQRYFERWLVRW